jgi:hypothetical protein
MLEGPLEVVDDRQQIFDHMRLYTAAQAGNLLVVATAQILGVGPLALQGFGQLGNLFF